MDYALCEATQHNMDGITRAVTFYDINCQYNKHLHVRVDQNQFLTMVPELTVIPGIGLWHIHGHQDSCYVRYASNFIEGIGRIDGEIMETLWAHLNLISPAAQGMSSPHRKECLDFQMNDSNFCKMICMKRTLCQKYKQAKNGIAESGKAFDRLDEAALANLKTDWLANHKIQLRWIYEINIKKGEITLSQLRSEFILNPALSKKEIELRLLQEGNAHHAAPSRRSVATWISMGLAIEEAQIALHIEIDAFTQTALMHLGEGYDADDDPDDLNIDILDDLDDDPEDFIRTSDTWTNSPELTVIPLPSNLGANDALHNLRIHLCNKAILFQTTVRQAKSQALKTRAWSQVTSVHQVVSLHASIYTKTRKQMIKLEPGQDQLEKYKPLLQEQLKVSTAVGDPNARGRQNESLAWFWDIEVDLGGPNHSWNEEFLSSLLCPYQISSFAPPHYPPPSPPLPSLLCSYPLSTSPLAFSALLLVGPPLVALIPRPSKQTQAVHSSYHRTMSDPLQIWGTYSAKGAAQELKPSPDPSAS
ncbi:uncharacterized protein EDB91DRAFT_1253835 [Suillus paluster]|uniref:uncharacterized protein n=1 Tax=Suillus paluster TaxID=48578 RepID=UPI001B88287C|nr:uncharacterized protein EDB91DRAFT_1253835 [Suillus paluster]KAG1727573.1 hypothetical protein EDB91DRAFT_1253835 [Suillus paluster]